MTLVRRRIFFAKSGMAQRLVDHFESLKTLLENAGASFDAKLLTDYNSGRSDRVVLERRGEREEDFRAFGADVASEALSARVAEWAEGLHLMIHYSETEMWRERS